MRRIQRNNFGGGGGSDIAQLLARLSGTASPTTTVPGFYDRRYRVVASGGFVDTIDDVRGTAGFGPQLVGLTTARPGWDSVNLVATFDGVNDYMETALVAAFDLNTTKTIIVGGMFTETAATGYIGVVKNAAASFSISLKSGGAANINAQVGISDVKDASSAAAPSATRRVAFVAASPASTVYVEVPAQAQVTNTHTNLLTSATYRLALGGSAAGAGVADFMWLFTIVLNRLYTTADKNLIVAWAKKNHATVDA